MEGIVSLVQSYSPKFVVVGSELGISCAARLAVQLRLEKKDTNRRCVNHAIAFFQQRKVKPVVIKTLNSADSDGVLICKMPGEIGKNFPLTSRRKNFLGDINNNLLIQEKIEGTQNILSIRYPGKENTISYDM